MQSSLERLRRRREELEGQEGGFTLIELLIVIVILGILAAIVVFAVQNLSSSSVSASCRTDFKSVESGLEAYKAQMGAYPTGGGTQASATPGTTVSSATATDTDAKAGPTNYTGTAASGVYPGAVIAATVVNAAANPGNPATNPPANTTYGGELLRGSNTAASNSATVDSNNQPTANLDSPSGTAATSTGAVGPWLKDAPVNNGHYTIFVANDGSGTIAVLGSDGKTVIQGKDFQSNSPNGWSNDINACSAVS